MGREREGQGGRRVRKRFEWPKADTRVGTYNIMARSSRSEGQVGYHCAMAFAKSRGGSGGRSEIQRG